MRRKNNTSYGAMRVAVLILVGVFLMAAFFVAARPRVAYSSSLSTPAGAQANPSRTHAGRFLTKSNVKTRRKNHAPALPILVPTGPSLTTLDSTCTNPTTTFNPGDTVCVRISGITVSPSFPRRLLLGNANSTIVQAVDVTTDPQDFTFVMTATSVVGGETVDNRGNWRAIALNPFFFYPEADTSFTVADPANPTADVAVATVLSPTGLTAGSDAIFDIQAKNYGPDNSANVSLTNAIPAGTTFVSFDQLDGPTFTCTSPSVGASSGTTTCTLASFAWPGAAATFRAVYKIDNSAALNSEISNTADIVSGPTGGTDDENTANNSTTSTVTVVATGGSPTCVLTCPEDISVIANTTEGSQRGAHVTFDAAQTSGDCGAVTANPASGSFFPVGTTTVNVTSATGGGSCSFTVTVEDNGTNPPTITCPAPQQSTADSNCVANLYAGTATATGDNVTVFATRSDGKAMYTCDANGTNCTRNSTDFPFPAGITTITWIAHSHSAPGPYADEDDEIAKRTGASSCTQTITVDDVTPPTITPPANQTVSAGADCMFTLPDYTTQATVSDNCACDSNTEDCQGREPITITQSPAPGTVIGLGSTTITLTANDGSSNNGGAGNTATAQFTVTVNDTTPPAISCPANITTNTAAGICSVTVNPGTATATDNCDSTPTIAGTRSDNQALNAPYPKGTTTIHWTATDDAGNSSSCDQTITVEDHENPMISCPANIVLEPSCPSGAVANWTAPVGTDNCPGAVTNRTAGGAPGSVFPIGTTTVTYTVTDTSGNTASCSFTVTVKTVNQTILDMEAYVNTLPLSGTQKQGLNAKLEAARTAPNNNVACNKLSDFISQVQAFINNGTLTSAQGTPLITSATKLRNTLGCTNNPCT